MREHLGVTLQLGREPVVDGGVEVGDRRRHSERAPHRFDDCGSGRLVEGHAERVGVDDAQVDALRPRGFGDGFGPTGNPHRDGVEERIGDDVDPRVPEPRGEDRGEPVHSPRDAIEPFGPVVHRVETGDHREQHLRGADVARRLLATDVLLASLEREPHRGASGRVDRHAHESTGQRALVLVADGEEAGVGAAEHGWHTEPLRGADDDVDADLTRGTQDDQREQIGCDGDERAGTATPFDEIGIVANPTAAAGVLQQHTEDELRIEIAFRVADHDLDAERLRPRRDDGNRLRVTVGVDEERRPSFRGQPRHHAHRLGGGRAFVEQRRVRDLHTGEIRDHRLEVEERLEPTLRDLGLVGRVRGVPRRVLEHIAGDHRRRERSAVAEADQRGEDVVRGAQPPQPRQRLRLAGGLRGDGGAEVADRVGNRRVDERVERLVAQQAEHRLPLVVARTDVAADESGRFLQVTEALARGRSWSGRR